MNIFFCDIQGTFSGDEKTRNEDLKKFINNLLKIIEVDNLENLNISFITTGPIVLLKQAITDLIPLLEGIKITLGEQLCDKYIILNSNLFEHRFKAKSDQILALIKKHKPKKVYYAEDNQINQLITSQIINKTYPNIKYVGFLPGTSINHPNIYCGSDRNIAGLNQALESYHQQLEKTILKTIN
ncbi:MAG: hypothetical protein RR404_01065 [Bacilli bacterium]